MKTFTFDTIHTMPDGRVTLSGPKGSIDIGRYNGSSVAQYWHTAYEQTEEENVEHKVHTLTVAELTSGKESTCIGMGESFGPKGMVTI